MTYTCFCHTARNVNSLCIDAAEFSAAVSGVFIKCIVVYLFELLIKIQFLKF